MTVRVSTRISIQWPPEPENEPTDTLVISVGEYYVDLRVLKSDQTLDWGLAGKRIKLSEDPLRVKFTHSVDSHNAGGSKEKAEEDVGEFTKLPNGDDLEIGEMPAPHLGGSIRPYREVWRELNAHGTTENENWILENVNDDGTTGQNTSITKTFYARAGCFFLGLRQIERVRSEGLNGSSNNVCFSAIRQDFDSQANCWSTKYRIGRVDGLWDVSSGQDIAIRNMDRTGVWQAGDKVVIVNNTDGKEETYVVRAVSK
ncbi:hypothetical protein F5884DRAFT_264074 [Xylogone sp. PMI_703]|nr:hypothetical protein F5884DRAFT_264074 [Xylogone sp. PMI_703]